jgi:hypothetical protein
VAHTRTYAELLAGARGDCLLEKERDVMGIDYCEAGGWLARNWDSPMICGTWSPPIMPRRAKGVFKAADLVRVAVVNDGWPGFALIPPPEHIRSPTSGLLPPRGSVSFRSRSAGSHGTDYCAPGFSRRMSG